MAACCSAEMEKTVTKNIRNKTIPVFILILKKYISTAFIKVLVDVYLNLRISDGKYFQTL